MYGNPQKRTANEVQELRREAGRWLKQQREPRVSRNAISRPASVRITTLLSRSWRPAVVGFPPDRYEAWALALGLEPKAFVTEILRFYDPNTYRILFG